MFYFRIKRLFAIYIEWNRDFDKKPYFRVQPCDGEVIFDMPYSQVILTKGARLRKKKDMPNETEGNLAVPCTAPRTSKNKHRIPSAVCHLSGRNSLG